ncbi:uncharacterized protein LOC143206990 isoform X6 [Lasioglossum baleicum]|uniref:uncharacterized protein LOC143206990 isoform X6 n=1 Tax=Lasioglossum baleicum TaxID=434251 RepID=UPI003FCD1219
MVVSHREGSISSNIRAIIEQLNLNPVERRRLIDRTKQDTSRCKSFPSVQTGAKISIGVYGCKEKVEYEIPGSIRRMFEDRSRKPEAPQTITVKTRPEDTKPIEDKVLESSRGLGSIKLPCKMEDRPRPRPECRRNIPRPRKEHQQPANTESDAIEDKPEDVSTGSVRPSCRIEDRPRSKPEARQRIPPVIKEASPRIEETIEHPKSPRDSIDRIAPVAKEDLPQLESASLNHTAAHHRISVRPKNRRPPRRTAPQAANTSSSTITTIAEDSLDSLDPQPMNTSISSSASSPTTTSTPTTEPRTVSVARKSSSRLSRNSDIFEELEAKLPRKPPSVASLSPDSLDAISASGTSVDTNEEQPEAPRPVAKKPSIRLQKGTEIFEELEAKLPRRRSSNRLSKSPDSLEVTSSWFSKSTEGFDMLMEYEESKPVVRRLLNPISKSTDRVSKSSDSLEAIETLTSDESIERRRSSFEFRARRSSKNISKSSENFDILEQTHQTESNAVQELQKRSSLSDMNLARGRRLSKSISKSSESFEMIEVSENKDEEEENVRDNCFGKVCRRSSKRMSSESSDNLEMEDRLENRRIRRTPKRIPSTSYVDIVPQDEQEEEKRQVPVRKPSRLQKSSESSELGSTDTLDSERRNKSSESTETLDSLERDLDQDRKQEDSVDAVTEKREKSDSWSNKNIVDPEEMSVANGAEDSRSLISPEKFYWRQSSESKENIDIHQLVAITIVTSMADNGNNQRCSEIYPKKKPITGSQPTSPVAKQQEDNKMIFDNLLVSKNDEDLQNMLNGNISEVSTDTKSFREKLIMFEKLGK